MFKTDFEWLTSNTTVAYPFVERVEPLNPGEPIFSDVVVDAYVLYDGQVEQSIKLAYLDDPEGASPRVIFKFADDTVAFDSLGGSFNSSTFGPWLLAEWLTSTGAAKLLFKASGLAAIAWPASPQDAHLVAFAIQPKPQSLRTVSKVPFTFDGTIELIAGFNAELAHVDNPEFRDTAPLRGRSFVRVDLSSGLGEGIYLDCEQFEAPLYTVNGVGPDENGNLTLDLVDCYRAEAPIDEGAQGGSPGPPWHIQPHTLKMYNDCNPCCSCEDYVYVYDTLLRQVYDRAKELSDRLYAARDRFKTLVERAAQEKTCREGVEVRLEVVARHGWTATIQVTVRNNGPCPIDYIYLDYAFGGVTRAEYVEGSGYLNSKTAKQERFDPVIVDPCAAVNPQYKYSSSSWDGGNARRKWREVTDPCGAYPHFYVTYTDALLGTDMLTLTYQVYFKAYGTREEGRIFSVDLTGFAGGTPVNLSARTALIGPYNKE